MTSASQEVKVKVKRCLSVSRLSFSKLFDDIFEDYAWLWIVVLVQRKCVIV